MGRELDALELKKFGAETITEEEIDGLQAPDIKFTAGVGSPIRIYSSTYSQYTRTISRPVDEVYRYVLYGETCKAEYERQEDQELAYGQLLMKLLEPQKRGPKKKSKRKNA